MEELELGRSWESSPASWWPEAPAVGLGRVSPTQERKKKKKKKREEGKREGKGKRKEKKKKKKKKERGCDGRGIYEGEGMCLPTWRGEGAGVGGKRRKRKEKRKKDKKNNNIIIRLENRLSPKNPQKYPEVENVILMNNMKSVFRNKIPFSN